MGLFSFLTQELAIDLGTANTLIIHKDKVVVDGNGDDENLTRNIRNALLKVCALGFNGGAQ